MANTDGNSMAERNPGTELARHILNRLFANFEAGIRIRLWEGSEILPGRGHPEFSLTFRSSTAFHDLPLSHHPLRVVESYIRGLIDVDGDFYNAIKLRHYRRRVRMTGVSCQRRKSAAHWAQA